MTKESSQIQAIEARIAELMSQINDLDGEAEELETAVRVLKRFSPPSTTEGSKLGPPRPKGIPTLFEMTSTAIKD